MKKTIIVLAGFIFLFLAFGTARAATFTVTKTADTNDGLCNADCSLREALIAVNSNTAGGVVHRIEFSTLFDTPQTIATTQFFLNYNTKVEIIGRGNQNLTITTAAGSLNGAFQINSAFCRIYNIKFINCQNELGGGAMFGDDGGDLIIERCLFENNSGYSGGALYFTAFSNFTVKNSTFRGNQAYGSFSSGGGAIYAGNYNQAISGSTFSGNQSPNANGAAVIIGGYSITTSDITNSTFSDNTATDGATIFNQSGSLTMTNITVANNSSTTDAVDSNIAPFANATISNSIVSQNSGGNVSGNIILTSPNFIGGNPLLGALANNGGETETLALLAGSPAIDAGNSILPTDQRGAARPQGSNPDLGAFESGVAVTAANTPTGTNVNASLGAVSVTFSGVSTAGTTTQIPISPSGTPPGGYSFGAGFPAFQISTTAAYTPPITLCLQVALSVPLATFNTLEILHFENGNWVALAPTTRNIPTYTICAPTNSLSPFAVAQNINPTAANVEISGRIFSENGVGAARLKVFLTDQNGVAKTAITNSFGVYRFDEIAVGTYSLSVSAKQTVYSVQLLNINESIQNLDFYPANLRSK